MTENINDYLVCTIKIKPLFEFVGNYSTSPWIFDHLCHPVMNAESFTPSPAAENIFKEHDLAL